MQIGLYEPLLTFAATKTGPFLEFFGQMLPIPLQLQFTQKCKMQMFATSYEFFLLKIKSLLIYQIVNRCCFIAII
jgi:hypothetical protein